jgi:multicomponent Na+:H+ antiporter subunit B
LKFLGLILMLVFAGLMLYGAADLPDRGDVDAPANRRVTPYYISNAYSDAGAPNMVTVVLVDYRGFDTLGETLVILAAALAVLLIQRSDFGGPIEMRRRRERKMEGGLGQADIDYSPAALPGRSSSAGPTVEKQPPVPPDEAGGRA